MQLSTSFLTFVLTAFATIYDNSGGMLRLIELSFFPYVHL